MAAGIPSTNQIVPFSREALQLKSKLGLASEIPGIFYNQPCPTAATLTSGTVVNDGQSLIGAYQLGGLTSTTLSWGGDAVATFSSSTGLLATIATSSFMPTTLNYMDFPVRFVAAAGAVLPTGLLAGITYYWNWQSATTGKLALSPGGAVIAYTDAGSGTIYCQAATQYWGSPFVPPGFLQAADGLNIATPGSFPQSGSQYRIEIGGHRTGAATTNVTLKTGLVTAAGATSWVALSAGAVLADVATGPFPFTYTADIIVQQYGLAAASLPYVQTKIRTIERYEQWTSATAETLYTSNSTVVTSIDSTQPLGFDVRWIHATPLVTHYAEPLYVRMWAFN
jgi:hypothetical protein